MELIQPFLATKDFEISKQFYLDFGFTIAYEDQELCLLKQGNVSFFIQRAYVKDWAENTMVQIYIDNVEALHEKLVTLKDKYPMIKVTDIMQAHYGKTFHLLDPAGNLFHLTNPRSI